MKSQAYEVAAAVLSGAPIPAASPVIDDTHVELKLCEWCPRTFARPIGSDLKHCDSCRAGKSPRQHMARPYRRTFATERRERLFDLGTFRRRDPRLTRALRKLNA